MKAESIPQRTHILQQMAALQTMEQGSLKAEFRDSPSGQRCGPYFKHQVWQAGSNLSRRVPPEEASALEVAIANRQKFEALAARFVELTVACTRQSQAEPALKKKDPGPQLLLAQEQEIQQLMARFCAADPQGGAVQQLEVLVRTAIFKPANALVGLLLQGAVDRVDGAYQPKPGEARNGCAPLKVQGLFGSFQLLRDYYYHPGKKQGHYPADAALGLEVGYTPALARLMCLEGADESSYQKAQTHLLETGGIEVSARQVQRVVQRVGSSAQAWQEREAKPGAQAVPIFYVSADGTGVPMRKEDLAGRAGKQEDGGAKTRMAYLGCVFTQHKRDEEGHPIRDYESTTYLSSFGSIDEFGPALRQEAIRRGLGCAQKVVLLIDGAAGLANMGRLCFCTAVQIVDFYHALEHAGQVLEALLGSKDHKDYQSRLRRWAKRLLKNRVESLIAQTRQECRRKSNAQEVEAALGYFVNNVERMQYGSFRRQGFFIGSGVIEAGCKTIIGSRCKQSGMFWGEPGAENILAFRCIQASRRLNEFWQERLNHHAARNDCLPIAA